MLQLMDQRENPNLNGMVVVKAFNLNFYNGVVTLIMQQIVNDIL